MPRPFPNELSDAIIAFVAEAGDRRTLLNCTLVCRDWLPASRHALFSDVELTTPTAWDSFLSYVVNTEAGRPWLASILRLEFTDKWFGSLVDGKQTPPQPMSAWRAQYVIPVLAGHLPSLESLSLRVDWMRCPPHPTTFGMFSQFTSLRELRLWPCHFPSFSTFRHVLVSLPALESLSCSLDEWPSVPQASILATPSKRPALQSLRMSMFCHSCTLAVLEWLVHTPTRSTLVDLDLYPGPPPLTHRITLPGRTIDYYVQIFAPSLRRLNLRWIPGLDDMTYNIPLHSFANLKFLKFTVDGTNWLGVADFLRPLPARLATLVFDVDDEPTTTDVNQAMREDGEVKAVKTDGLEHLDLVLSHDNFENLRCLRFERSGYRDALATLRESTLQSIQQKLPKLHGRSGLPVDIQLNIFFYDRPASPSPLVESTGS